MMNARTKSLCAGLLPLFLQLIVLQRQKYRGSTLFTIKPAYLKEEILTSTPQPNDSLSSTEKTGYLRKNLDLSKIILKVDDPDDYFFGIFPENDNNKALTINNDIINTLW